MTTPAAVTPAAPASAPTSLLTADHGAGAGAAGGAAGGTGTPAAVPPAAAVQTSATGAGEAGGVADPKAAEEKLAADKAAADARAAPLGLKIPDGFQAGEGLAKFEGLAKEAGLDGPKAQKILDLWVDAEKTRTEAVAARAKAWADGTELKADKEFGGAAFDSNMQIARKAIVAFASPEEREWLAKSGAGNAPQLIKLFNRIGKAIAEDSVAGSTSPRFGKSAAQSKAEALEVAYPSMFPKKE